MASLQIHDIKLQLPRFRKPFPHELRQGVHYLNLKFPRRPFSGKVRVVFACIGNYRQNHVRGRINSVCCFCTNKTKDAEIEEVEVEEQRERPPFDINLAVVLAGFAFEAYTTPPENIGRQEVDAAGCKTLYLSESFVREIYDGQLFIKLKKGFNLPAMDPWGTSDPYVVMQLDGQVVKSKVKWGKKEPTWNEDLILNIKQPTAKSLQIAAWDANLVTPHKRMGNTSLSLERLCDGNLHEVLVELEGMGGGGKLQLEVKYKSFDEIEGEKKWWKLPFVVEFLKKNGLESAIKTVVSSSEAVPARQFVEYAFGQLKSFNDFNLLKDQSPDVSNYDSGDKGKSDFAATLDVSPQTEISSEASSNDTSSNGLSNQGETQVDEPTQSEKHFWKNFADIISQNVVQKLGVPVPEKLKWDSFDLLHKVGLQSRKLAEAGYIQSGLAKPEAQENDIDNNNDNNNDKASDSITMNIIQPSLLDIKKATTDLLRQTDSVLGALMVLTAAVSQSIKEASAKSDNGSDEESSIKVENDASQSTRSKLLPGLKEGTVLDEKEAMEMKALFSTAESAMEAWAMLATSLGHPSFIKSEFEKICFLDNVSTDTQVAIWRDLARKRLVIAFRGTEQAKWKDLLTDLMLVPAGLNPERIGGDFKHEVQVHGGFLSAYDSVRIRIISMLKLAVGYTDEGAKPLGKWHVYVTGHSLGGALATLLALELSSGQLVKHGAISVTMYNFGSPRVGNKRFAEVYNEKVKDSWRVVNHRDIIPTVPRLMGYCHVAEPVYLTAGELRDTLENLELQKDGYQGDVIGEATPDVLVTEFMKGEKELIEKILQTEINIFRAIRDGSALMQHMEDFYYISLLEKVRSNYRTVTRSPDDEQSSISVG